MTEIRYRTPGPADKKALCELGRDSFVETFGHLYARDDLEAFLERVFGPTGMPAELGDPGLSFHVAEADGRMIAYCKIGSPTLPYALPGRRVIELRQLYVLKPWQGAGVAAALMDWALDQARGMGAEDMLLSVWAENERAKRFYGRYGFVEVGRYAFMVGSQADDERIMRLTLDARAVA